MASMATRAGKALLEMDSLPPGVSLRERFTAHHCEYALVKQVASVFPIPSIVRGLNCIKTSVWQVKSFTSIDKILCGVLVVLFAATLVRHDPIPLATGGLLIVVALVCKGECSAPELGLCGRNGIRWPVMASLRAP